MICSSRVIRETMQGCNRFIKSIKLIELIDLSFIQLIWLIWWISGAPASFHGLQVSYNLFYTYHKNDILMWSVVLTSCVTTRWAKRLCVRISERKSIRGALYLWTLYWHYAAIKVIAFFQIRFLIWFINSTVKLTELCELEPWSFVWLLLSDCGA